MRAGFSKTHISRVVGPRRALVCENLLLASKVWASRAPGFEDVVVVSRVWAWREPGLEEMLRPALSSLEPLLAPQGVPHTSGQKFNTFNIKLLKDCL